MEFIFFEESGETEKLIEKITEVEKDFSSILIFSADANELDIRSLNPVLRSFNATIIGGIFPSIIYQEKHFDKGSLLIGFKEKLETEIIENISHSEKELENAIADLFEDIEELKTILLFVDGFSKNITKLIDELYINVGLEANYIGGGAGSLSFVQKPVIFTNRGVLQDSVIFAHIPFSSSIGVTHGWKTISGPYQVTESKQNKIIKLNHQPAFEVYKNVVEEHSNRKFDDKNFFDIAKGYPFGINKLNSEKIVRDPIVVEEDGSLICVGDVPENSYLDILNGDNKSLIEAAGQAKEESLKNSENVDFSIFIDCISRVLFLQDEFVKELEAVKIENTPLVGALTLGEIANNGDRYLEFYNKTSVFATLNKG